MSDSSDNPVTHEIDEALLEEVEFEDAAELDLLRTVEMGNADASTRPMLPALEATTRPMEVPAELLNHARATLEGRVLDRSVTFELVLGDDGIISIPAEWRAYLAHREVEVVVRPKD